MPLGYDIKEEATEVKKNLFERRDNFIMLVVAGVVLLTLPLTRLLYR